MPFPASMRPLSTLAGPARASWALSVGLSLCAAAPAASAQINVDAGPDQTVTFGNSVAMNAAVDGGTPLEYWAADGNGIYEDKLNFYHSVSGLSSVGPLQDGVGTVYPWPTDMVWINGVLYGHDNFLSRLYTLNPATGIVTPIGSPHPQWANVHSMAYDEAGGRLFAIDLQEKQLLRIDPVTGATSKVGTKTLVGNNFIRSLAYDAANDRLIADDTGQQILIAIDPDDGTWTFLMNSYQDNQSRTEELVFFQGELYAARGLQNPPQPGDPPGGNAPIAGQLQHVDLATGLFTNMGPVLPDVQPHSLVVVSVPEVPNWTQTAGPGIATIHNPRDLRTTVSFDTPGTYLLTLTVHDGLTPYSDDVEVTVTLDATTYCTAKVTSCGNTPFIAFTGVPSAAASSGFTVEAMGAKAGKAGLLIYSDLGRNLPAPAFGQGGYLCILGPRRAPLVTSSGTPPACDGVLSFDMNAFAQGVFGGNPKAYLKVPGTTVNVQWWGRDTFAWGNFLTDGLEYIVGP